MTLLALTLLSTLAAAPAPEAPLSPERLDPAVPACDDFYAHAVGGWLKANPVPPDKSRYGAFDVLYDRNQALLRAILEETAARRDWPAGSARQKVGDLYASGMDEAAIEKLGTAPLRPWLARVDAVKGPKDLAAFLAAAHEAGLPGGFGLHVDLDEKDSTRTLVALSQGGLGLPDRDYYLKDDARAQALRAQYVAAVARLLELAGQAPESARTDAERVLSLETALARASRTRVALREPEPNYNLRAQAALASEAPGFEWGAYLAKRGVPAKQVLDVGQPEFMTAFARLAATEPPERWRAYLRWHVVRALAPLLPRRFEDARFAFYGTVLQGVEQQEERWKRVLGQVDHGLGEALGQLYVERTFSPQARERVRTLVENLRAALRERIEALPWMSAETKAAAQRKLAAFGVKVGYPDRWRDYRALAIRRGAWLDDVLAANRFEARRQLAKLGKPVDRSEWHMTPPTVNAYYNPNLNEIVFPAGILQPPFFWAEGDDAVNYGAIGVVIGHEMTHGFDDQGSQYDAEGNLKNWWTEADRKAYAARTDLMVKQFDAYRPFDDAAVDGKLTVGENIADLGGLKLAWAALQKALGQDPLTAPPVGRRAASPSDGARAEPEQAELESPARRFFLAYATVWENNIRGEALRVRLATDPHSPGRYRVLGPLSNLPEFHAAFSCPEGAPMRRPAAERPEIW